MKRKIIKQKTAYTITLPIKWIREHNLNAGGEVEVAEDNSKLTISTEKKSKAEEVKLVLESGVSHYYRIMIENYYLKGYDILEVGYSDQKAFYAIQQTVSNLIGFEIVDQSKNKLRISSTATPTNEEFERLLRRCFNIITYTQETVKKDLENNSFPNFKLIEEQTKDVRRFLLFCTRALHKNNIVDRRNESFLHLLLERLILIQHNHYYMYQKLISIKNHKIRKEVIGLYFKVCTMFSLFYNMFYKKSTKEFAIINKEWDEIYFKEGHELFEKCTKEESFVIYHSMHLSKLLFLISQPNLTLQLVNS